MTSTDPRAVAAALSVLATESAIRPDQFEARGAICRLLAGGNPANAARPRLRRSFPARCGGNAPVPGGPASVADYNSVGSSC